MDSLFGVDSALDFLLAAEHANPSIQFASITSISDISSDRSWIGSPLQPDTKESNSKTSKKGEEEQEGNNTNNSTMADIVSPIAAEDLDNKQSKVPLFTPSSRVLTVFNYHQSKGSDNSILQLFQVIIHTPLSIYLSVYPDLFHLYF